MLYLLYRYLCIKDDILKFTYMGAKGNHIKFFCYKLTYNDYNIYFSTDFKKICFVNIYSDNIVIVNKEKIRTIKDYLISHGINKSILEDVNITSFKRENTDIKQYNK